MYCAIHEFTNCLKFTIYVRIDESQDTITLR